MYVVLSGSLKHGTVTYNTTAAGLSRPLSRGKKGRRVSENMGLASVVAEVVASSGAVHYYVSTKPREGEGRPSIRRKPSVFITQDDEGYI